ncbi:MAG: hypothetical protein ABIT37_18555 [Luteolibacter sp.]
MKLPWTELTFLILGWFLGLVAGPVQDWLRRCNERKQLRRAIWTELNDLRERLAQATFVIESKRDGISRDLLNWLRKYIVGWNGVYPSGPLSEASKRLSELNDDEFAEIASLSTTQDTNGLSLQRYEMRYLSSKLERIEILPEQAQQNLLSVLTHVSFINQHVSNSEFYRGLTFDAGISEGNHAIASAELKRCQSLVAQQARSLVRSIDVLEVELNERKKNP